MELMCRDTRRRVGLSEGETIRVGRLPEWKIQDRRISRHHCAATLLKGRTLEVWNDREDLYIERKATKRAIYKQPGSRSRIKVGDVFYLLKDDGELRFRFELRRVAEVRDKAVATVRTSDLFLGLRCVFLTKTHIGPLRKKLLEHGGVEIETLDSVADYGIVSDDIGEWMKQAERAPSKLRLVKRSYLSDCLVEGRRLDDQRYHVQRPTDKAPPKEATESLPAPSTSKSGMHLLGGTERFGGLPDDYDWIEPYDVEEAQATVDQLFLHWTHWRRVNLDFDVSEDSEGDSELMESEEEHSRLNQVRSLYHRSREDQFKKKAIDKAIRVLESLRRPLKSVHQIEQLNLGKKTTDKLLEVFNKGYVQRTVEMADDTHEQLFQEFSQVWGAGEATAQKWISAGCTSLQDVQRRGDLTEIQEVGLKYYQDFQMKIPREEVQDIYTKIKTSVIRVIARLTHSTQRRCKSQLFCAALGSFVRGKDQTGDIDILISPPENTPATASFLLQEILLELLREGVITPDLHPDKLKQNKAAAASWMGVSPSPVGGVFRRVDIKVYQRESLPFALNYFTGSSDFVRALRYWCNRPKKETAQRATALFPAANAFQLSDHALSLAERPTRRSELVLVGSVVPCKTETDIFEALGLSYVPPWMRIFSKVP